MAAAPALLVATRSAGKVRELLPMLREAGFRGVTLDEAGLAPDPAEDGIEAFDTFEDNAIAKARWFSVRAGGMPVLADDSGLAVDALGGAPGVRSKRWAWGSGLDGLALDAANNAKLARELSGAADRGARYVCVAAIAWNGHEVHARGECVGRILHEPQGTGGFGYDPWFWSEELGTGFGLASLEAKAQVSHRGRAMRAVLAALARVVDPLRARD
jgi:XTP/dITP diphosphohydrolase